MLLEELDIPLHKVKGIGPATQKTLGAMGITQVRDLVWHLPRDYEDRSITFPFKSAIPAGGWVNTRAQVVGHEYFGSPGRKNLKILVQDGTAQASLTCFGRDFLARQLPAGTWIRVCGTAQYRFKELQIAQFEFELDNPLDPEGLKFRRILPRYPLGGDLNQGFFRRAMETLFAAYMGNLEEFLPEELRTARNLVGRSEAFRGMHFPDTQETIKTSRQRLAYEELLLFQVELLRRSLQRKGSLDGGPDSASTSTDCPIQAPDYPAFLAGLPELSRRLVQNLPFQLTPGQVAASQEIRADLDKTVPMARLLQGDVGSGKTLVALLACLEQIAKGHQAAILVPTVLLARQHASGAQRLLGPLGINIALMAGPLTGAARKELTQAIREGQVNLVIGTHGLFSSDVDYADLRLVVIDEQHRFGVMQRQALFEKARFPHLLMMSATPIPQTLAMTVFGDMEVTLIKDLPASRKPIDTHLARMGNEQKVYDFVRAELDKGHQAYFVYPLIEGDDDAEAELKNAQAMFQTLSEQVYPGITAAMIHSKMDEEAKAKGMEAFSKGEVRILVATSVVEVGVDVPNATCMVIEHAERFGLSALHQLRGRVGRGSEKSYCFLVYREPLSDEGKSRLMVMKNEHNGFVIAEEDLKLRGPGDLKGLRQSGMLRLKVADLSRDMDLMHQARADARSILSKDPGLTQANHLALERVLSLSEKHQAQPVPTA